MAELKRVPGSRTPGGSTRSRVHLILSVDYELFGNGSGGITECVIGPSEDMATIAERYNAPLTFFVDTLELKRIEQSGASGAVQIHKVRTQLREFLLQGHDLQLHLHPQWDKAVQLTNRWDVVSTDWRIGDLPSERATRLIKEGKNWLLQLTEGMDINYRCEAFRAGGWAIQPAAHVVKALIESGFSIDSTVAPGLVSKERNAWFDFRRCPSQPWWHVSRDVCAASTGKLIEVPIAVGQLSRIDHLHEYFMQRNRCRCPKGCVGSYQRSASRLAIGRMAIDKMRTLGRVMLDFSMLSASAMIRIVESLIRRHAAFGGVLPLVGIAHSKTFSSFSAREMPVFLSWVNSSPNVQFATYGQWLQEVQQAVSETRP